MSGPLYTGDIPYQNTKYNITSIPMMIDALILKVRSVLNNALDSGMPFS